MTDQRGESAQREQRPGVRSPQPSLSARPVSAVVTSPPQTWPRAGGRHDRRAGKALRVPRRALTAVLATTAALAGAGAAFAYWTVSGRGTATATVQGAQVSAVAGSASGLYPGGPTLTMPVRIANQGVQPYAVSAVLPSASGLPSGCPTTALLFSTPSTLPTLSPSSTATVGVGVAMATDAPIACQGATANVPVHVTGTLR